MKYLALIIVPILLIAGCVKTGHVVYERDYSEINAPIRNSVCTRLCNNYSVFSDNRFDVPYNEDRQLKTVLRRFYINKLDTENLVLSSCRGNSPQNLNCVFIGDEIAYNIRNDVCYHYDTIIIPKLSYDTDLILTYNFMKNSRKEGNTYYSRRLSSGSNWNVTVGDYIQIDIEWICD